MRIELVDIAEYFDRAVQLFEQNWAETGFGFPLKPQLEMYQRVQACGVWFAIGAFDAHGNVIGYSSAAITPHLFNPEIVVCASDALFVLPEHRNRITAGRLMVSTEREARRRGARYMMWHTRAGTPLARMLRKRGYTPADEVVMKEL